VTDANATATLRGGLWDNNPGLVQLLGLCPLLAVSTTLVNGLALGLASLAVMTATSTSSSLLRHWLHPDLRLPVLVLLIASLVTAVDLLFRGWLFELHLELGLFVPLIVTNCVILARAESYAIRVAPAAALADGFAQGLGFAAVLGGLGALRELLGHGSLLQGADRLFGPVAAGWQLQLLPGEHGLLLASLPPGAFFGLALLVALRQRLAQRRRAAAAVPET